MNDITDKKYNNTNEKKVILYMVLIALILVYISLFFIHDIVDKGAKSIKNTGTINYPDTTTEDGNNGDGDVDGVDDVVDVVDNSNRVKVKEGQSEFNELKNLEIYTNHYFNDETIIAPGVKGTYTFTVENETNSNYIYGVFFTEQNDYNINMVYKIKLNGRYIYGSDSEWITHQDFTILDLLLNSNTTDVYTIEWKWEDTDYDTQIGKTDGANYRMNIKVEGSRQL